MPQSTLGYEKLFNWAFADMREGEFVRKALEDQPVPPRYFASMKKVNRTRQPVAAPPINPRELDGNDVYSALQNGAIVVDTRSRDNFAAGHIPGTLNIPSNKSFLNWTGALVPADSDFYLITEAESEEAVKALYSELAKIGLTPNQGFFGRKVFEDWKSRRGKLEQVRQLDAARLRNAAIDNNVQIVDVRGPDEWRRGHLPGAMHIPLAALPERIGELNTAAPIVLHCKGGGRAAIAASFLQARGITNVSSLVEGYDGWVKRGFEVE
jgi:hydroxyacylglutathione hydrolase